MVLNLIEAMDMAEAAERNQRIVPELCAVCSDKSTGLHYGVATCNGCKTFFRRTVVNDQHFGCKANNDCHVEKAIQGERDKIGYTKRRRIDDLYADGPSTSTTAAARQYTDSSTEQSPMSSPSSTSTQSSSSVPPRPANIESLIELEAKCNKFRMADIELETNVDLRTVISRQSSIINDETLLKNARTFTSVTQLVRQQSEDIVAWHRKDLLLMIEWAKEQTPFPILPEADKIALLRNHAFAHVMLQQSFYSQDFGPDIIVMPNGTFMHRVPADETMLRPLLGKVMDQIMLPIRRMSMRQEEFIAVKAIAFWNPEVSTLTPDTKDKVMQHRNELLAALFNVISASFKTPQACAERFGRMLLFTPHLSAITAMGTENMYLSSFFNLREFDTIVKELLLDD
uniref:Ligand-binding domain of nuclear hormone receptor n=1 Tax=Plectus sambesii TaxID=2011161 RepID=A0A914WU38_9BILA